MTIATNPTHHFVGEARLSAFATSSRPDPEQGVRRAADEAQARSTALLDAEFFQRLGWQ
jgi:hypothetical protein